MTSGATATGSDLAGRTPCGGADLDRSASQQMPAMLAQRCAVLLGQGRHIRPGRADSERERLPPLLERGMTHPDRQGHGSRLAEASLREEPGQMTFPDAG